MTRTTSRGSRREQASSACFAVLRGASCVAEGPCRPCRLARLLPPSLTARNANEAAPRTTRTRVFGRKPNREGRREGSPTGSNWVMLPQETHFRTRSRGGGNHKVGVTGRINRRRYVRGGAGEPGSAPLESLWGVCSWSRVLGPGRAEAAGATGATAGATGWLGLCPICPANETDRDGGKPEEGRGPEGGSRERAAKNGKG